MIRKILSGLFLVGAIIFFIILISNFISINNTDFSGDPSFMFFEVLSNLFYLCSIIICLIISSSLYIIDVIKSKRK